MTIVAVEPLPDPITDEELFAIAEVWRDTTGGPWHVVMGSNAAAARLTQGGELEGYDLGSRDIIAASYAPVDVPRLLAEVKRQRAEILRLRAQSN